MHRHSAHNKLRVRPRFRQQRLHASMKQVRAHCIIVLPTVFPNWNFAQSSSHSEALTRRKQVNKSAGCIRPKISQAVCCVMVHASEENRGQKLLCLNNELWWPPSESGEQWDVDDGLRFIHLNWPETFHLFYGAFSHQSQNFFPLVKNVLAEKFNKLSQLLKRLGRRRQKVTSTACK